MAEFELYMGTDAAASMFADLDDFTQGYVTAMFWTDCSSDSEDMADASFDELAPDALAAIVSDCADWQAMPRYWPKRTSETDTARNEPGMTIG